MLENGTDSNRRGPGPNCCSDYGKSGLNRLKPLCFSIYSKNSDRCGHRLQWKIHNDKVDILRAFVLQRNIDSGQEFNRSEIDIEVQLKPHSQKDLPLQNARSDIRVTDSTQKDGIPSPKFIQNTVRKQGAVFQIYFPNKRKIFMVRIFWKMLQSAPQSPP